MEDGLRPCSGTFHGFRISQVALDLFYAEPVQVDVAATGEAAHRVPPVNEHSNNGGSQKTAAARN